ncbi:hypothetical protein D3C85_1349180 [compost metagenome]
MATLPVRGEVALEVHLPQVIRGFVLEPLPGLAGAGLGICQAAVAAKYLCDGAGCKSDALIAQQHMGDLAPAPSRMTLPDLKYLSLKCFGGPPRCMPRACR